MDYQERSYDASSGAPVLAGARAASLLEEACRGNMEIGELLRMEVVGDLARDLRRQLEALARYGGQDNEPTGSLVEAALACADLSTLAACVLRDLSPGAARKAASAVREAADAVGDLSSLVETKAKALEGDHADHVMRDIRAAGWRAGLAVRQADDFLEVLDRS